MTAEDFRRLALALPGTEEGSYMGAVDFRVGGRIFATLASVAQGYGNLMLTLEAQQDLLADALRVAWILRVERNNKTVGKLPKKAPPRTAAAKKKAPAKKRTPNPNT